MAKYYSCEKIWDTEDADGEKAGFYIVCSRVRSMGKTFSFINKFLEEIFESNFQKKLVLMCRTQTSVGSLAIGQMKPVLNLKFPAWSVYEKRKEGGKYSEIWIKALIPGYAEDDEKEEYEEHHIGYVMAIKPAHDYKNISGTFSDATWIYFDEFQPEFQSVYITDEIEKFQSILGSLSRGIGGEQVRRVPVYMTSNTVSMYNPYFDAFGLYKYIQPDTKFYRGYGVVYEMVSNSELAKEHAKTGYAKAFRNHNRFIDYEGVQWYNNESANVTKPNDWGESQYLGTLVSEQQHYSVYYYPQMGFVYVKYGHDKTSKARYRLNVDVNQDVQVVTASALGRTITQALRDGRCFFATPQVRRMVLQITGRL